jgi:hypothetical protein
MEAHQHWVFAVEADCYRPAMERNALHRERLGDPPLARIVERPRVAEPALIVLFPRAQLTVDEVLERIGTVPGATPAEVEAASFICVTPVEAKTGVPQVMTRWITCPSLLNSALESL